MNTDSNETNKQPDEQEFAAKQQQAERGQNQGRQEEVLTAREVYLAPWMGPKPKIAVARIIIFANLAVYAAMAVFSGLDAVTHPDTATLLKWGADWGPDTFEGEYWRMLSSTFVHSGFLHIGMNMAVLNDISKTAERIFGSFKFLILYLIAGIGGSLFSLLFSPNVVSVGASGAVFGVYGAMLAFLLMHKKEIQGLVFVENLKSLGAFVILNLVLGFSSAHTDNAAHIGGFTLGFIEGFLLLNAGALSSLRLKNIIGTALVATLLWNFYEFDKQRFATSVENISAKVSKMLDENKKQDALNLLDDAIKSHPDADLYELRAIVFNEMNSWDKAFSDANKALELNPKKINAILVRAECFEERKDLLHALEEENKAIAIDPSGRRAYIFRANTYALLGDYKKAIADIDKAIENGGDKSLYRFKEKLEAALKAKNQAGQ